MSGLASHSPHAATARRALAVGLVLATPASQRAARAADPVDPVRCDSWSWFAGSHRAHHRTGRGYTILVNGRPVRPAIADGYARLNVPGGAYTISVHRH
jgi:hypothetical protein